VTKMAVKELTSEKKSEHGQTLLLRSWAMQMFVLTRQRSKAAGNQIAEFVDRETLEDIITVYQQKVVPNALDKPTTKAKIQTVRKTFFDAVRMQQQVMPHTPEGLSLEPFIAWAIEAWKGHDVIMIAQFLCQGVLEDIKAEAEEVQAELSQGGLMQDIRASLAKHAKKKKQKDAEDAAQRQEEDQKKQEEKAAAKQLGTKLKNKLRPASARDSPRDGSGDHSSSDSTPRSDGADSPKKASTPGVSISAIMDVLGLEDTVKTQVDNSQYSVWRSLNARKLLLEMISVGEEELAALLVRFEHQRRMLTKNRMESTSSDFDVTQWPPEPGEASQVAHEVLDLAWANAGAEDLQAAVYDRLMTEFMTKISSSFSGQMRGQM